MGKSAAWLLANEQFIALSYLQTLGFVLFCFKVGWSVHRSYNHRISCLKLQNDSPLLSFCLLLYSCSQLSCPLLLLMDGFYVHISETHNVNRTAEHVVNILLFFKKVVVVVFFHLQYWLTVGVWCMGYQADVDLWLELKLLVLLLQPIQNNYRCLKILKLTPQMDSVWEFHWF